MTQSTPKKKPSKIISKSLKNDAQEEETKSVHKEGEQEDTATAHTKGNAHNQQSLQKLTSKSKRITKQIPLGLRGILQIQDIHTNDLHNQGTLFTPAHAQLAGNNQSKKREGVIEA